jgi:hypothetical protein
MYLLYIQGEAETVTGEGKRAMRWRRRPTISIGDGLDQWEYENMGNE